MMRWLMQSLVALALTAAPVSWAGGNEHASLSRARTELVERTRDYRASLERLLSIHEGAVARAENVAAKRRSLYAEGIVSRRELEESEQAEASARAVAHETRRRLAETDAVLGETLAAIEVARAAAPSAVVVTPEAIGSLGDGRVTAALVGELNRFFAARFARALPVSALGQTPVHDRLGLDHHHALDIAVHPDSEEGRALLEYLERHRVPFLAFRGVVPGASTGAHVHVGRASLRLGPASTGIR
jgi:hypothetical protein